MVRPSPRPAAMSSSRQLHYAVQWIKRHRQRSDCQCDDRFRCWARGGSGCDRGRDHRSR
ncbi:MAG: hypothetical protein MZV64_15790 [Ignavibacteriales bacterium]|nr:hypothetical protein [Ignavibacteriales bacterium]